MWREPGAVHQQDIWSQAYIIYLEYQGQHMYNLYINDMNSSPAPHPHHFHDSVSRKLLNRLVILEMHK